MMRLPNIILLIGAGLAIFVTGMAIHRVSLKNSPPAWSEQKVFFQGKAEGKELALTFDIHENSPALVDLAYLLDDRDVEGTFFLSRRALANNENLVRFLLRHDQDVGPLYLEEVDYVERDKWLPRELRGKITRLSETWFNRGNGINGLDGTIAQWSNIDPIAPGTEIIAALREKIYPGAILRLGASAGVVEAMPAIIDLIEGQGYEIEEVSSLIED